MELSIIVLSYNTKDLILKSLKSVIDQYRQELEDKKIEIIVVDNNSKDHSVNAISDFYDQSGLETNLKIILNKENLGFSKGCNIGAKSAKGKYILFLNSDTEVLNNRFLSMVDFLNKNPNVAILGGKLENNNGTTQKSCGKFYNLFNLTIMLFGLERFGFLRSSPSKAQGVDWVSGACMMVRKEIFEKLDGFDENFFMYIEDMEICFRAKKMGFLTYFYPNLRLKHKSEGSSNKSFAIINIYKGILHFYLKHKSYFEYLIAKTLLITKAEILILIGYIIFNKSLIKRYREAIS